MIPDDEQGALREQANCSPLVERDGIAAQAPETYYFYNKLFFIVFILMYFVGYFSGSTNLRIRIKSRRSIRLDL